MTAKNNRICQEIQNKRIVPVIGGLLYLLCWSKAATIGTTTGRNSLWCFPSKREKILILRLFYVYFEFQVQYVYFEFHGKSYVFWFFHCHYKFPYISPAPPVKPGPPRCHVAGAGGAMFFQNGSLLTLSDFSTIPGKVRRLMFNSLQLLMLF